MADITPEAIEGELASLADRLTEPGERECLRCYVLRMMNEFGCDGTYRWTIRWRDVQAVHGAQARRGFLRELEARGGFCDCEILLNVYPDYPEAAQPLQCAGIVRPGSPKPCALRPLRKSA